MTDILIELMQQYSYAILFFWSMIEGESGLIMAGIFSHTGHMNLYISIFVAGLGGSAGDLIYFYIGRKNKKYVHRKLIKQRRKFALAHVLLKKYGWPIIFAQRYMYGMRTMIPIAIGLTGYDARKFALINLLSAWTWAAITISLAWYFGQEILTMIKVAKEHWYIALPLLVVVVSFFYYYFNKSIKLHKK